MTIGLTSKWTLFDFPCKSNYVLHKKRLLCCCFNWWFLQLHLPGKWFFIGLLFIVTDSIILVIVYYRLFLLNLNLDSILPIYWGCSVNKAATYGKETANPPVLFPNSSQTFLMYSNDLSGQFLIWSMSKDGYLPWESGSIFFLVNPECLWVTNICFTNWKKIKLK